jgi:hypothetical protein
MKRWPFLLILAVFIAGVAASSIHNIPRITPAEAGPPMMQAICSGSTVAAGEDGGTIGYESASKAECDGSTTLSISAPSGISDGDLMVAVVVCDTLTDPSSTPSGWTEFTGSPVSSLSHRTHLYYKEASSESGTYDWGYAASQDVTGVIARLSKTGGTWDVDQDYDEAFVASGSTTVDCPALTATDSSMMILASSADGPNTVVGETQPASMTFVEEQVNAVGASCSSAMWYQAYSSGSTGTKTVTYSSTEEHAVIGVIIDLVP